MAVCSVGTTKYEADIGRLMERRLDRLGGGISPECGRCFAEASIEGGAQLAQWCEAVAELLLMDLAQFEIAYMVNGLPLTLEEKKAALQMRPKTGRLHKPVKIAAQMLTRTKSSDTISA